jgi:hypothetical protein
MNARAQVATNLQHCVSLDRHNVTCCIFVPECNARIVPDAEVLHNIGDRCRLWDFKHADVIATEHLEKNDRRRGTRDWSHSLFAAVERAERKQRHMGNSTTR